MPLLLCLLPLGGCDSPSPAFMGAETTRVAVGGYDFSVHRKDDAVEVLRLDRRGLTRERDILLNAMAAIELSTGCGVRDGSLTGDQAIVRARLDCTGTAPPLRTRRLPEVVCDADSRRLEKRDTIATYVDCVLDPS